MPLGAVAGTGYLYLVSPNDWIKESQLGMTRVNVKLNVLQAVGVEIVATMVLVLLVLVISDPDPHKEFEVFTLSRQKV